VKDITPVRRGMSVGDVFIPASGVRLFDPTRRQISTMIKLQDSVLVSRLDLNVLGRTSSSHNAKLNVFRMSRNILYSVAGYVCIGFYAVNLT